MYMRPAKRMNESDRQINHKMANKSSLKLNNHTDQENNKLTLLFIRIYLKYRMYEYINHIE